METVRFTNMDGLTHNDIINTMKEMIDRERYKNFLSFNNKYCCWEIGFEVLRRLKNTNPDLRHSSEIDEILSIKVRRVLYHPDDASKICLIKDVNACAPIMIASRGCGKTNMQLKYLEEMIKHAPSNKEDKKMDIKLYECGTFVGGGVTKPQDLIKNVIFSGPCTIVQWTDGDKTIVRCENEDFDKEKGLAMAIVKKFFGTNKSKSNYNDIFKKWIPEEKKVSDVILKTKKETRFLSVKKYAALAGVSESTIRKQLRKGQYPYANKVNGKWQIPYSTDKPEVVEKIRGCFK